MFENVALRTGDGEIVTWATIPRFTPPMEVVHWGRRLFVRRDDGTYAEGAFFVVLPGWEAPDRETPSTQRSVGQAEAALADQGAQGDGDDEPGSVGPHG